MGQGVSAYAKPNEVNLDALEGTWHPIASACSTRSRFGFRASHLLLRFLPDHSHVLCPKRKSAPVRSPAAPAPLPDKWTVVSDALFVVPHVIRS